jgi:hypothetical protein
MIEAKVVALSPGATIFVELDQLISHGLKRCG